MKILIVILLIILTGYLLIKSDIKSANERNAICMLKCKPYYGEALFEKCRCDLTKELR